jgi:hypothetical protein
VQPPHATTPDLANLGFGAGCIINRPGLTTSDDRGLFKSIASSGRVHVIYAGCRNTSRPLAVELRVRSPTRHAHTQSRYARSQPVRPLRPVVSNAISGVGTLDFPSSEDLRGNRAAALPPASWRDRHTLVPCYSSAPRDGGSEAELAFRWRTGSARPVPMWIRMANRADGRIQMSGGLTNRWGGRVKDGVPSSDVGVRAAQLNR